MNTQSAERYLNEKQVAEIVGLSVSKLRHDRSQLRGIPFIKIHKTVRYRREDIDAYLAENLVRTFDSTVTP